MWNQETRKKKRTLALPVFPKRAFRRGRFLFFCLSDRGVQSVSGVHTASCVCPQNTTDSSSNSSQKLESSLQPLESSPLPQRHRCMLGHRHDLHDPYRLSDHYFMDQVRHERSVWLVAHGEARSVERIPCCVIFSLFVLKMNTYI